MLIDVVIFICAPLSYSLTRNRIEYNTSGTHEATGTISINNIYIIDAGPFTLKVDSTTPPKELLNIQANIIVLIANIIDDIIETMNNATT